MASNVERLRQGEAIEFEPGLSGRLNKENKTLELSNGRVLNVGHNPNYFPRDEKERALSQQKEYIERKAKGTGGEFYHQFSTQGLLGSGSDIGSYLTQSGDEYATRKQAEREVSNRISEESPYTSAAATAASFVPDIVATRGMSALKAAPLLTAASSGSRLLTNPGEVIGESLVAGGLGYGIDKTAGYLNRVSSRRAESRAMPGRQQAVTEANALQNQEFKALKQNNKLLNEATLGQHENDLLARKNTIINETNDFKQKTAQRDAEIIRLKNKAEIEKAQNASTAAQSDAEYRAAKSAIEQENKLNAKGASEERLIKRQNDLNERQNKIIEEKNAYEQRKFQRDEEIIRLKNKAEMDKSQRSATAAQSDAEFRAAKSAAEQENKRMTDHFKIEENRYQQELKELPELQKKAQKEYSANVVKNAEAISNSFPEEARIFSSQFGVNEFIDNTVKKSKLAGSKEASQSARILNSLFPEGEILTRKELASRYKSLEGAIQKSSPEIREVLNDFKMHMGDRLPSILADNMAYTRVMPTLKKAVEKEVNSILDSMALAESGIGSRASLKSTAQVNINQIFRELSPEDFIKKMHSGEIRERVIKSILTPPDFKTTNLSSLKNVKSGDMISAEEFQSAMGIAPNSSQARFDEFNNFLMNKLDKEIAKAELKMIAVDVDASKRLGGKVKNTFGLAEPVPNPKYPNAPELRGMPSPPPELPPLDPFNLPPNVSPPTIPPMPPVPPLNMPDSTPMPQPPPKISATPFNAPPPVSPPNIPPMPGKPSLIPEPMAPNAIPNPTLAPAQGMAESMGDFLEKPMLGGGRGLTNNPLVKLGGLKYLLGKAALPAEAAYLAMKGLTSPTAGGELARMTFKQAGIEAIKSWAEQYPSYKNGILQSPQDRRSLTKEIEDDFEIPLEQKAVLQSKVNRGKPLTERL